MRLETDRITIEDVSAAQLRSELALLDMKTNMRAILSSDEEVYLQTAAFDNGFVVERRDGSEETHSHAVPPHGPLPALRPEPKRSWWERLLMSPDFLISECAFSQADMTRIFLAYHAGKEAEPPVTWEPGYCDR